MSENIVITGTGVITAAGNSLDESWEEILRGDCFIRKMKMWSTEGLRTDNFGEIYLNNEELKALIKKNISSHKIIPMERGELMLFIALEEAIVSSGICFDEVDLSRVAVLVGTSLSGFTNLEKSFHQSFDKDGRLDRRSLLAYPLNVVLDRVCFEYGFSGARFLFSTACSASLHSVEWGAQLLDNDEADIVIMCGTDPLSMISTVGFSCLRSLAETASSPFSEKDPGVSIGEGAGVIIIEREDFRERSNSSALTYLSGCSGNADAYHPTASDPMGTSIKKCIDDSLGENSNLANENVLLFSHGTGTPHNDNVETRAVKQTKLPLERTKVVGLKSIFGHTLGASGIIELALLDKCLKKNKAIPTANFTTPRKGCDLDYVKNTAIDYSADLGLKSAFAFGGNNVVVSLTSTKEKVARSRKVYSDDPIVITGLSMINGFMTTDPEEIVNKVLSGNTAVKRIEPITGFSSSQIVNQAAVLDDDVLQSICEKHRIKNLRTMDRISKLSTLSAVLAVKDSGYKINASNTYSTALISGTSTGPLESVRNFYKEFMVSGAEYADAGLFPNTVVNAHAGYINIQLRIKGYTNVLTQGNITGMLSLDIACRYLRSGMGKMALVGSTGEYSEAYHRAMIDLNAISESGSVYDRSSNGYILGEGSTFFTLERKSDAEARNAKIYATIKDVKIASTPTVPSTFLYKKNPLDKILKSMSRNEWNPDIIIGDGLGVKRASDIEVGAIDSNYKDTPITTFTPYFGNIPGVNTMNNIAMHCLLHGKGIPGLMGTNDPISKCIHTGDTMLKAPEAALVTCISEGGMSGAIALERHTDEVE